MRKIKKNIQRMTRQEDEIVFFDKFSNPKYFCFSPHHIAKFFLDNEWWLSVSHYYYANKVIDSDLKDIIRQIEDPTEAKSLCRTFPTKENWENLKYEYMYNAMGAKFLQNRDCLGVLISTKNKAIIEDSPFNYYWGGKNNGLNMLGKILEQVRSDIRNKLNLT